MSNCVVPRVEGGDDGGGARPPRPGLHLDLRGLPGGDLGPPGPPPGGRGQPGRLQGEDRVGEVDGERVADGDDHAAGAVGAGGLGDHADELRDCIGNVGKR